MLLAGTLVMAAALAMHAAADTLEVLLAVRVLAGAGGGVAGAAFAARGYPTSALLAAGALLLAGIIVKRFLPEPAGTGPLPRTEHAAG